MVLKFGKSGKMQQTADQSAVFKCLLHHKLFQKGDSISSICMYSLQIKASFCRSTFECGTLL